MKNLKHLPCYFLLSYILLMATTPVLAQGDELLPPEQAFNLQAWMEGDNLIAQYQIAPGYYMYRQRFAFQVESGEMNLGEVVFPTGKIKSDEFFGDMEVYRDNIRIVLPLVSDNSSATQFTLKATSQGCADIGVCYPPLHQQLDIDTGSKSTFLATAYQPGSITSNSSNTEVNALAALLSDINDKPKLQNSIAADNQAAAASSVDILESLGESVGLANESEIPHPDTAFMLAARKDDKGVIQTDILIYPGTYLYRDKFKFDLIEGNGHSIGPVALPQGDTKDDEFFGRMQVYHDRVKISIPVNSSASASERYTIAYQYQGCVEDRICYPPITKYLAVDVASNAIEIGDTPPGSISATPTIASPNQASPKTSETQPISEQDWYANLLQKDSMLIAVLLFFLGGIGLTFTPCVFPMIPILSSIIAGQGESITTRKAFTLSLVYVLSMAATYAIIGAIVGFYGAAYNIQIWFQDPLILSVFAFIFVLLSLSMFGFYDIQMPNAIQSRLSAISNNQQGGTLIGVGIMGLFSAIIVGPCITAPLVGALIFISQTQDWRLGGLALFALGLGMGTPLLAIGTSAGTLLPKAGLWMDKIKSVFGVVLLGVAVWLLERILPTDVTMLLIAILVIGSAVYMGALESLPEGASGWKTLKKAVGIILLIYGASYLVGAAAGSKDLIQPLRGIVASLDRNTSPNGQTTDHVIFQQVKGEQGLQMALDNSVRQGLPTMLDFYADWCISCKEMEKYAFSHPRVIDALSQVVTLQADVTQNDQIDIQLMEKLGIYGPPAILFYDVQGQEIRHRRVVGEMSGEEFAQHVIETLQ